jgi:hypothetical protein
MWNERNSAFRSLTEIQGVYRMRCTALLSDCKVLDMQHSNLRRVEQLHTPVTERQPELVYTKDEDVCSWGYR